VYPGRWNAHRFDVKFLLQFMARRLDQQLDWQFVNLKAPLDHLMAAPILYLSGKGDASWGEQEQTRLKEYIDAGGFVLIEAAAGDEHFDRAVRAMVRDYLPQQKLEALPRDHPVYTALYDIPLADRPPLEAVMGPCWVSLLYAPRGLSCEWDIADYEHANFRLGANIAAYVTGMQKLEGKLSEPVYYRRPEARPVERRGAFTMGQIVHGANWQPHKLAWGKVLEQANSTAGLSVYSRPVPIRLGADSPFEAQMLYLTGIEDLTLAEDARKELRLYLERGGFVFAEAACSSPRFDASFRELMLQPELFPDQRLRRMPFGHPLFRTGFEISAVSYSPSARQKGAVSSQPMLEFIEMDGRAAVVYSKLDISSAIDGHPCHGCASVLEPSASQLAMNIVLYGLAS
jgi:hypothetical protein